MEDRNPIVPLMLLCVAAYALLCAWELAVDAVLWISDLQYRVEVLEQTCR